MIDPEDSESDKEVARVRMKKQKPRRVKAISIIKDEVSTEDDTEEVTKLNKESENIEKGRRCLQYLSKEFTRKPRRYWPGRRTASSDIRSVSFWTQGAVQT